MSLEKSWKQVQAYKHNGDFHRQWSVSYVLKDTPEYYALVSVRCVVTESDGRKWHTKEPAIFILFKQKWFNVIAMFKENNNFTYYVNIASPTIFDKGYLKYIDYDLDVKLFSDGSVKLLDVSEFEKHAKEQSYSQDVIKILQDTVDEVYKLIQNKSFPFDQKQMEVLYKEFTNLNK